MTHDEKCRHAGAKYARAAAEKLYPTGSSGDRIMKRNDFEGAAFEAFRAGFGEGLVDATRRVTCFDQDGTEVHR